MTDTIEEYRDTHQEELLDRVIMSTDIRNALAELDHVSLYIVEAKLGRLRDGKYYDDTELASILGTTEGEVVKRYNEALAQLATLLGEGA